MSAGPAFWPGGPALLDPPPYPAMRFRPLALRIAALLGTHAEPVFVLAEAVLALEAVARAIGQPGLVALNLVTSPYGAAFGEWIRRAGGTVHEFHAAEGRAFEPREVAAFLERAGPVDLVALTHGEAASGVLNPLAAIATLARAHGAAVVVDAVASAFGHALDLDLTDIVVIGPQKALAGPAGLSMVFAGERGWSMLRDPPGAARSSQMSMLSLDAARSAWRDDGWLALPGTPPPLEFWALDAAVARAETETLGPMLARHGRAAAASRSGLRALGIAPWVAEDADASHLVTTFAVPSGLDADRLVSRAPAFGVALGHAGGDLRGRVLRFEHMGRQATRKQVLSSLTGLVRMLDRDDGAAPGRIEQAVMSAWPDAE